MEHQAWDRQAGPWRWLQRLADDLAATRAEVLGLLVLAVGGVVLTVFVVARVAGTSGPGTGAAVAHEPDTAGPGAGVHASAGPPVSAPSSTTGAPGPGSATPSPGPTELVVHVTGAVAAPGVLTLPAGARLVDAVEAAGGATDAAGLEALNLAAALQDGQQLHVPTATEVAEALASQDPPDGAQGSAAGTSAAGPGGAAGLDPTTGRPPVPGATGPTPTPAGPLDLNLATTTELEELPGVGPVLAGRIVAWRDQHGGFDAVGQLREVTGIGEKTFQSLAPLVTTS